MYVQSSIGSRNSAIHNVYHTSLRPSSLLEPRHLSLKVVNSSFRKKRKWKQQLNEQMSSHESQRQQGASSRPPRGSHPLYRPRILHEESCDPRAAATSHTDFTSEIHKKSDAVFVRMILPQVHLRKPCYDFSFL